MESYSVYLHLELLDVIPKSGSQKALVVKFIRFLGSQPFTSGDFTDRDASQRTRQIKIIQDYAITYWADHPAKAVMIVDIRPAD